MTEQLGDDKLEASPRQIKYEKRNMLKRMSSKTPILVSGFLVVLAVIGISASSSNWGFTLISEPPKPPLKVGTNIWPGYEPLYLARELGYYENGLIRLVEYSSATQVIRAYRNNAIQVAALTMDEVLLLLENGLDPRVILVMDISNGADAILAKPKIKSLKDLRDHKIGVESTALGAFFINQALSSAGLLPSDVTIISSEINEHERMFVAGEFDAVVTFEPVRSRLLVSDTHQIFSSSDIPGEIVDVLVIAKETLENSPEAVNALLKGWFKALDYFNARPQEAALLMARRLRVSPEEVLVSYKGMELPNLEENLKLMVGPQAPLKKTATKLANVMLRNKLLQKEVIPTDFIYPSALENIETLVSKASLN